MGCGGGKIWKKKKKKFKDRCLGGKDCELKG